jgi:FAD/FMN-containing dehydrogenase
MTLDALRSRFRGAILTPDAPGYDDARRPWNGMIDRRPAASARCTGPDDVVAAVRFAASGDPYPAVRAGGHDVAGLAALDDGL